jgi:hypothetical protein
MSFLTAQNRVNASVLRHLANARVLIAGVVVDGIFKNPSLDVALGMGAADTRPSVTVASSAVPEHPVDSVIDIDGAPYIISAHDPDGTGLTVLRVERTQ